MVDEVRRQFREIKGILRRETPDYARCVEISTKGKRNEDVIAVALCDHKPVVTGLLLGVAGVMGLLAGGLGSGLCWRSSWLIPGRLGQRENTWRKDIWEVKRQAHATVVGDKW